MGSMGIPSPFFGWKQKCKHIPMPFLERAVPMHQSVAILAGTGIGAGMMYLLDPNRGKRRRALVRDHMVHLAHQTYEATEMAERDLSHRFQGTLAELRSRVTHDHPTDAVLTARVRAKLGHLTQHPGALEVTAKQGHVTVSGPIRASEKERLLAGVCSVQGVKSVEGHLDVYQRAEERPDLEGGQQQPHEPPGTRWSPTKRLIAVSSGGALILVGIATRGVFGTAAGIVGLGFCTRGLTNLRFRRLIGLQRTPPIIPIQKTLTVHAPLEHVYDFWTHYEQFPRFLPHIREVRWITPDHSRWVVTGPLGIPVWWEARVTRLVPNELLAWDTLPGSQVAHSGSVRFESGANMSTRLDIQFAYTPPGGVLGHLLATLLGANPKHLMDRDLVCFKSLLEDGKISVHGKEVTFSSLTNYLGANQGETISPVH
jgi:uncharacterized membrane protein